MARRDEPEGGSPPFNSPFRDLGKRVGPLPNATPSGKPAARAGTPAPPSSPPAKPTRHQADEGTDEELFQAAVRGVVPIPADERGSAAGRPRSLIHNNDPTRPEPNAYAVFCF
jgi:hypothetical protein